MKSNDALDARISALENLVSVLILSRVAEWENPSATRLCAGFFLKRFHLSLCDIVSG